MSSSEWLCDGEHRMYHVLKDFAGPVATIIAATVAVVVTWCLGRGQLRIAGQQAKTALERLQLDLYEKRFNIYVAVLDLYQVDMHTELDEKKEIAEPLQAAKRTFANIKEAERIFVKAFRESQFLFEIQDGIYDTLNKIKDAQNAISADHENRTKQTRDREYTNLILESAGKARLLFPTLLIELETQLAKYLNFGKI